MPTMTVLGRLSDESSRLSSPSAWFNEDAWKTRVEVQGGRRSRVLLIRY